MVMGNRVSRLQQIDDEKRATLRKLAAGAAFAAPLVLSFSVGSLAVTDVRAYVNPGDNVDIMPVEGETTSGRSRRRPGKPVGPS